MSNPEIELPRRPSQMNTTEASGGEHRGISGRSPLSQPSPSERSSNANLRDKEYEKEKDTDDAADSQSSKEEQDQENEIRWHYLEFETELPQPTSIDPPHPGADPPPPPPDLKNVESPFNWPKQRKDFMTWLSVTATMMTAFTAGSYSPGIAQMTAAWHVSEVAALVGITIFTCGFAVAPMILAPFSEINGRKPVFMVTGVLFVLCQLMCAITQSYGGMLAARFWVGVGGSTFSTMVGGVVADIYHKEDRNTPMALFSGAALLGTGLGPLVCGFVAEYTTWRWIFYIQTIVDGVLMVIILFTFKETRGSILLSRKAKALNKWYEKREAAGYYGFNVTTDTTDHSLPRKLDHPVSQRIRWRVKSDEERISLTKSITISLYRPFHLLVTEPVVFWFSAWVSFSWAVLYLTLAAVPLVFSTRHGFTVSQYGSVFTSLCVGAILMTIISVYQERLPFYRNSKLSKTPEGRLYFACCESALMPIGLFIFGWTSYTRIHWIAPCVGLALATMGIFSIYLATFNYLADTYHRYASSALAAQSACRNLLGGAFPLFSNQMYRAMGYGPASSLLGGVGFLLTLVPWVLVLYGPRIRKRSKIASELVATEGKS